MSGEAIKLGKLEVRYLVDGAATGGLGVFELTVPPGAIVPPPHSHTDNAERIYMLEGALSKEAGVFGRLANFGG